MQPPNPRKTSVWPVFVIVPATVISTFLIAALTLVLFMMGWSAQNPSDARSQISDRIATSPGLLLALALESSLLMLVAVWFANLLSGHSARRVLRLGPGASPIGRTLLFILMTLLAGLGASNLVVGIAGGQPVMAMKLIEQVRAASGGWLAALVVAIVLVAPVCEEVFFRGFIQTRLRARWGSIAAIVVTSLMFGAFHLDPRHAISTLGIGLVLGWSVELTGSIRTAILAHMTNNLLAVVAGVVIARPAMQEHRVAHLIYGVAGVLLTLAVGWYVRRRYAPGPAFVYPASAEGSAAPDALGAA